MCGMEWEGPHMNIAILHEIEEGQIENMGAVMVLQT